MCRIYTSFQFITRASISVTSKRTAGHILSVVGCKIEIWPWPVSRLLAAPIASRLRTTELDWKLVRFATFKTLHPADGDACETQSDERLDGQEVIKKKTKNNNFEHLMIVCDRPNARPNILFSLFFEFCIKYEKNVFIFIKWTGTVNGYNLLERKSQGTVKKAGEIWLERGFGGRHMARFGRLKFGRNHIAWF